MTKQINPLWTSYNNVENEGGEGYNPHPKWIDAAPIQRVAAAVKPAGNRMLKDERGNLIPEAKLSARLSADEVSLPNITNDSAREIIRAAIAHARSQLGN